MSRRMECGDKRQVPGFSFVVIVSVLLVVSVLLTSCDATLTRTPRQSEAWSKGLPLGLASLNNRVAFAVAETGAYAIWVGIERDLRFVHLSGRASIEADRALDLELGRPQQPQLVLDADGQLHLVWLDKVGQDLQVMYARLSADGATLQGATRLSNSVLRAGVLAMALDTQNRTVEVFWSDTASSRPGIYHAALGWAGTTVVPEELLIPDGLGPAAEADQQGYIHLAWRSDESGDRIKFHYAVYDPRFRALGPVLMVGEPTVEASLLGGPAAGGKFDGPQMGLDEDSVYLAWTLEVRQQGRLMAFTFYQAFPLPVFTQAGVAGPLEYDLPEVTASPVHVRGGDPALTGDPKFLAGQHQDQVLACFTQAFGPRSLEMLQSAVVYLPGPSAGMDVVSGTTGASMKPNIAADAQGYLHLVWIDTAGFERYKVVYASTAPQVQDVLNPVTLWEALNQILELSFGAVALIGFLPLYLMWAVPAFLLLFVFYVMMQEVDLAQRRAVIVLWAAVGVHALVKLATAGGALDRLNSGGVLAQPWIAGLIRWLVPLLITGLAALVMRFYIRRTGTVSMFAAFFVFVLSDAVLFSIAYLTPLLLLG